MITIFTPTYNRKEYIEKVYKSLINQTNKDLVWLIIDDGSIDQTEKYIHTCIEEKKINIEYYKQNNQGKHIAYNNACNRCKTDFMICLDSDDYFSDNAVEELEEMTQKIKEDIWAVIGPRIHENGQLESEWKVTDYKKIKFQDIYQKYNYIGETYILLNMKLVKKYQFPKFEGEKFIPENAIYDRLDNDYYILPTNKKIYISDYKKDGYTNNGIKIFLKSNQGFCYSNLVRASSKYNTMLKKAMAYARYIAIKKVFKVRENIRKEYELKINVRVRIVSTLFIMPFCVKYKKYKLINR